jgi:hypothetical protein
MLQQKSKLVCIKTDKSDFILYALPKDYLYPDSQGLEWGGTRDLPISGKRTFCTGW